MDLEIHPAAMIFPEMDEASFASLQEDIRNHGQHDRIILCDGKILDGRHRYRACKALGITPLTDEWQGDDPVSFVVSKNLYRRHLSESQRGIVGARIANMPRGRPEKTNDVITSFIPQTEAAAMMNIHRDTVRKGKVVLDHGTPELVAAVEKGEVSIHAASKIARLPEEEQRLLPLPLKRDRSGSANPPPVKEEIPAGDKLTKAQRFAEKAGLFGLLADLRSGMQSLALLAKSNPLSKGLEHGTVKHHLARALIALERGIPHATCPGCDGKAGPECLACHGEGWVSQSVYETLQQRKENVG